MFFELNNQDTHVLNDAKLELKILDKGFLKDVLIGYFEFDISGIYLLNNHALLHKWVALNNPESDNFGEITGYIKLSISVLSSTDEPVELTVDTDPDRTEVVQAASIMPEYY